MAKIMRPLLPRVTQIFMEHRRRRANYKPEKIKKYRIQVIFMEISIPTRQAHR